MGIEVAQSNTGIVISQRKYGLDILEEIGLMNSKSVDTPMDPNVKLLPNQGEPFSDPEKFMRLVGKLNYLTVTRSNIFFVVSVVSQFLNSPCEDHWNAVRSSAKAKYRAMASTTSELIWLKQLLKELQFGEVTQMKLICDNQIALHISSNPFFHERTKHIEIDCHFVREKIILGDIKTEFVNSNNQLADIFSKPLRGPMIDYICNKLSTYDLYALA